MNIITLSIFIVGLIAFTLGLIGIIIATIKESALLGEIFLPLFIGGGLAIQLLNIVLIFIKIM